MSVFNSIIYGGLFYDEEVGALFCDRAEIDALIKVEVALARAQGELGVIPESSASFIQTSLNRKNIESTILSSATKRDGVPLPSLIKALREEMDSPEHAQYLHWGATSQDIMDTGLVLRLKQVCEILEARLKSLLRLLAAEASNYAELLMAARTRTQIATPTSFGAIVAGWGLPLLAHLQVLAQSKPRLLRVSLAGASGNSSVMDDNAAAVRTALASELGLADSAISWHSDRSSLVEFASLLTRISGSLAKIAGDCAIASQTEVAELGFKGGGSSTMPQKNNPVVAETIQSLFHFCRALDGLMSGSLLHRQQRDGAAWMQEWLALPQICISAAKSLSLALDLIGEMQPNVEAMDKRLTSGGGLIYAEAISFKLAEIMPRPEAQEEVRQLCIQTIDRDCSLPELVAEVYPDIDWQSITAAEAQSGDALQQAREFIERVQQIK